MPAPEVPGIFCNIHTPPRLFQRSARTGLAWPLGLTAALLLARAAGAPPLSDPLGAPLPAGLHLGYPWLYVALAPLFSLWDGVSMLSLSRLRAFLTSILVLYLAWRLARMLWRRLAWRSPRAGTTA